MRESKAELTDRLRREGRWEAFKKRREELKAGGMPAPDAWISAAAEFPPPVASPKPTAAPTVDLRPLRGKRGVPVVQAAAWAFEHLDDDRTQPADAPSAGAWSMREWARSSMSARSEFYRTFVVKLVLPAQEKAREAAEVAENYDQRLAELLHRNRKPKAEVASAEDEAEYQRFLKEPPSSHDRENHAPAQEGPISQ